jgi:hypothetical protein
MRASTASDERPGRIGQTGLFRGRWPDTGAFEDGKPKEERWTASS